MPATLELSSVLHVRMKLSTIAYGSTCFLGPELNVVLSRTSSIDNVYA